MKQTRIEWACRRGMLELDLILQPYAQHVYPTLSPLEQSQFEQLLSQDDPLLYQWLMGKEKSEDEILQAVVNRIRTYTNNK